MGLRVGEIAALRPVDFGDFGSSFAFRLGSTTLKNEAAGRPAPVPCCVLRCGLIEFVLRADEDHQTHLVELPGRTSLSRTAQLNDRFARYVEGFCAGHAELTLRSLRSTYLVRKQQPEHAPMNLSHMYVDEGPTNV